jgi:hypothetical protein
MSPVRWLSMSAFYPTRAFLLLISLERGAFWSLNVSMTDLLVEAYVQVQALCLLCV